MAIVKYSGNGNVDKFLEDLNHPLIEEINELRKIVLSVDSNITEYIKWNAPSFCYHGKDRITMRIHPPTKIQLIFHRGAKVVEQPVEKLIDDTTGILKWKTNDRAVATFLNSNEIKLHTISLSGIVKKWINASLETE